MIKENEKDSSCPKSQFAGIRLSWSWKFVKELGEPPFRGHAGLAVDLAENGAWFWTDEQYLKKFVAPNLLKELLLSGQKLKEFRNRQTAQPSFYSGLLMANMSETVIIPSEGRDGKNAHKPMSFMPGWLRDGPRILRDWSNGFWFATWQWGKFWARFWWARDYLDDRRLDWPILRNLVFMGMGEPLANLDNVLPALQVLNHDKGLNFSRAA